MSIDGMEMAVCPECGADTPVTPCYVCMALVPAIKVDPAAYPPVTWQEIQDFVVSRLLIDEEWLVRGEDMLTWWPYMLPQDFVVTGREEIDHNGDPDIAIRITVETNLGRIRDRDDALQLVSNANLEFPFGSFIATDEEVFATFSLVINSRGRSNLSLLTHLALIQAVKAQEVAQKAHEEGVLAPVEIVHPASGKRHDPDELLSFYETFDLHSPEIRTVVDTARRHLVHVNTAAGATVEKEFEEATILKMRRLEIGIGIRDDEPYAQQFGAGLVMIYTIAQATPPMNLETLNSFNLILANGGGYIIGHFGSVVALQMGEFFGLFLVAQVPYHFHLEFAKTEGIKVTASNASYQASVGARYLFQYLHGDEE